MYTIDVFIRQSYPKMCLRSANFIEEVLMRASILQLMETVVDGVPQRESPNHKCSSNVGRGAYRLEQFSRRNSVTLSKLTRNLSHRASSN